MYILYILQKKLYILFQQFSLTTFSLIVSDSINELYKNSNDKFSFLCMFYFQNPFEYNVKICLFILYNINILK
jgi:hypothetical protein